MNYRKPEPKKTEVKENPDDWWSNLTSSAKKEAKKFWSAYKKKMNDQKNKIETNVFKFKINNPISKKAIEVKKKP